MIRKIYVILLLTSLAAPVAATYTWLQYQKILIRKEVKQKIGKSSKREAFILLKFTKEGMEADLHWKDPKEFEFRDQMYDVIEREQHGDTIYFWCWRDHEETRLSRELKLLFAHASDHDAQNNEQRAHLTSFLKLFYYSNSFEWKICPRNVSQKRGHYYCATFQPVTLTPPEPPPETG